MSGKSKSLVIVTDLQAVGTLTPGGGAQLCATSRQIHSLPLRHSWRVTLFGQHSAEKLLPCCEMSCSKPLVLHTCWYTQLTIPLAKSSEPDPHTVLGLAHGLVSLGLLALGSSLVPRSTSCRSIPIHGAQAQCRSTFSLQSKPSFLQASNLVALSDYFCTAVSLQKKSISQEGKKKPNY